MTVKKAEKTTKKDKPEAPPVPEVQVDARQFDGLRSMYLVLENFKNITKKVIKIGGRSVVFLGPNGSGKSSLIQAMKGSMNSKQLPSVPVKLGEEHAQISHRIAGKIEGEYHDYIIDIYFNAKSQEGRVKLTNGVTGEDISKSAATRIKDLIGNVSFSVTSWLNQKKDEKLKTLKRLTGKGQEIDAVNEEIKELKAKKKAKDDRASDLEGALKNHGMSPQEIERYSTPVDITPIQTEMEQVAGYQAQYDQYVAQVTQFHIDRTNYGTEMLKLAGEKKRIEEDMARMQIRLNEINKQGPEIQAKHDRCAENIRIGEEWKKTNERPTIQAVSMRMTAATEHNTKHSQIKLLSEQHKEMVKLKQEILIVEKDVIAKEQHRSDIITNSQLPVKGLMFTDDEIFLDGVPLEEGQQNTQKLWHIGVQVAKAMHPNYRGIFIDDGSLFDKEHLEEIVKEIEKGGEYFAIIEMVDFEGTELEAKFTEEII